MALRDAKHDAEEFLDTITTIVKGKDNLIYSIETDIRSPNVISPSTVGDKDAIVRVKLYNVSNADNAFSIDTWIKLSKLSSGIDKWDMESDYALIEFHKRSKA